ncbi:MAG: molybdopterin-dependent oxidoreductase [Armatimonadetes bacterium]|nr:molybdopterin-dependent oxidoreductase [Armatimonadota bacterium]
MNAQSPEDLHGDVRRHSDDVAAEKTVTKTIGFIGFNRDSNSVEVDVRGGRLIRIRPLHFDARYTREELGPWQLNVRGCILGASTKSLVSPLSLTYKKRIYSPNRIPYPLKRVDWDPDGERNPQNRGTSGYERISWDEALDIIVSELTRIKERYGMSAVLSQSDGHGETKLIHASHGCTKRLLDLLGPCTWQHRNPDSWEGWYWGAKHVWGMDPVGQMLTQSNVIPDIAEHSGMVLFWGCDPETTPWGFDGQMASRVCYWLSDLGIKSVYICPDLNYGAAVHADNWIPIRPNTDAALQLAIAYVWIQEGTYEQRYLDSHAVGFEKFRAYVLGEEDGVAKTPDWAAPITGVKARVIKALAREWASTPTSIAHGNGGCYIRGPYATEPGRLEVVLLAMQALGAPGRHQVKMLEWGLFGDQNDLSAVANPPLPRPVVFPSVMAANCGWGPGGAVEDWPFVPKDLIHDALNSEHIEWYGKTLARIPTEDQFVKYSYPMEGCSEIHMIWTDSPCWITCWNDSNSYIKGLLSPKVEFILAQQPWMENDCQFADLVLPVSTKFESKDIAADTMNGSVAALIYDDQAIEPRGEAHSDYEICCMIAERLGLLDKYTGGRSVDEWIKAGFDGSGVQDLTTFEEFKDKRYFVAPTADDWRDHPVGLAEFYADPEGSRLSTPSGKLEIYSERLATMFPDDEERPPLPKWIPYGESHQESLEHPRSKKYPLLLISNHGRWRVHAQHDDVTWLREIQTCKITGPDGYGYQPLWINPVDAVKRGIQHGDIVRIYNERGAVLAGAYVTERIAPDSLSIDHGARYDPIVVGELDRGGAINTITPHNTTSKNTTGMAVGGFLVEVEPVDLEELRRTYPEAFARPYHAGAGLCVERVIDKGGTK